MIDTEALRKKIINLAIQGKLTPQLPEDGNAEYLYAQIQEEKAKLIREGKIKREKPLPEISDDEIPFEIPKNWKWVQLNDIGSWSAGATPSRKNKEYYSNGTIPWIKTGELNDGYIYDVEECITDKAFEESSVRLNPIGSVLIAMYGATIGKVGILGINATTNQACCACIPILIDNRFLFYFLKGNKDQFINSSHGGAQPNISKEIIVQSRFPLPPLAEQKRIVEILNDVLAQIDIIDALQKQYEFDREVLKGKIIDAGIRGMLTEQLPEDGNAEDLYAQIQKEKAKLIKEGKIKKGKPLPEISDAEVPFEIPDNWKWVYMGDVFEHNTGKALNNADKNGEKLEYITTSNMYWDHFELDDLKSMYFKDSEIEKCTITKGDLLICEGGDIGRSAIWPFDYDMRIQNHIHKLRGYGGIDHKYYYYIMRNYKDMGMIDGRGIGLQGFSSKRVHFLIVPLPPLEEQKRIVEKIQGLVSVLE